MPCFVYGDLRECSVSEALKASDTYCSKIYFTKDSDEFDSESFQEIGDSALYVTVSINDEGEISGASLHDNGSCVEINKIAVIGDDILFSILSKMVKEVKTDSLEKTAQVFGGMTTGLLSTLSFGIVGVSGTGSIVAEQLYRMQVGKLVLIDDDEVESKNLGRIINASKDDSERSINKAVMMKQKYDKYGLGTEVVAIPSTVSEEIAIRHLAQCDILIGCMDSVDGRHHLNLISSFYVLPYFDIGVKLVADGTGNVDEVTTAIQYIIPGESSLLSRGVYNAESLQASELLRSDPIEYQKRLEEKYIEGANENSPAVISVNMAAASMGVIEILARIHPFREEGNELYQTIYVDLMTPRIDSEKPSSRCNAFGKHVGKGDVEPLLELIK